MNLAESVDLNNVVHFDGLDLLFEDTAYLKYYFIFENPGTTQQFSKLFSQPLYNHNQITCYSVTIFEIIFVILKM